jgi:hypothetical protein
MVIEMSTTVAVSENTRKSLLILKIEEGYKNIDELVSNLILRYKKQKLLESSELFKQRMDLQKLTVQDLIE